MIWQLLLSTLALAASSPYCRSEAAKRIELPLYPGQPERTEKFTYTYALGGELHSAQPWIVVLPGGPGQASIPMPLAMPSGSRVLRIDPRQLGDPHPLGLKPTSGACARAVRAAVFRDFFAR